VRHFLTLAALSLALGAISLPASAAGTATPVSIPPFSMFPATSGISYSATVKAVGGTAPYTFSVVAGGLPKGLSLSTDGTIGGVPDAAPGPFSFTVQALDTNGATGTTAFSLMLATPVIRIASTALPGARVSREYRHALRASGGSPSYTWRLARGSLPAGLSLTSGGVIFGSPRARGVRLFTLQAVDAHGISGSQTFRLVVRKAKRTRAAR
jgi:hypothetical protein